MSAKDCEGHFSGGWGAFYSTGYDVDTGNPHLRTYQGRQAEKFYETFKDPYGPQRMGKHPVAPPPPSTVWGIGGDLGGGRKFLVPPAAEGFKISQKKYIEPPESGVAPSTNDLGKKKHVYTDEGYDRAHILSKSYFLENMMSRKGRVPEEMRTGSRTIHRMAPPGLKGYMGAEYSNDFFMDGHPNIGSHRWDHPRHRGGEPNMPTGGIGKERKKTFKEKRIEEDLGIDVALVTRLQLEADGLDSDEEAPAPAPAE